MHHNPVYQSMFQVASLGHAGALESKEDHEKGLELEITEKLMKQMSFQLLPVDVEPEMHRSCSSSSEIDSAGDIEEELGVGMQEIQHQKEDSFRITQQLMRQEIEEEMSKTMEILGVLGESGSGYATDEEDYNR